MTNKKPLSSDMTVDRYVYLVRAASSIDIDLARKQIPRHRAFFFFGFNNDVGTSYEDIHPNGGNINWQEAAVTVEIVSTNAADTSDGLGVQSVEIHGLSDTGEDQDEVIATNGTSAVTSAKTYRRINKMHNEAVGTYGGSHQGNITCQVESAGAILSQMTGVEGSVNDGVQYGSGEAGNGYWSVPLGKVLYITELTVNIDAGANKTADVVLYEREGILDTTTPFDPRRVIWNVQASAGEVKKTFKSHIKIKELTDLWFRAKGSTTGVKIACSLDFYLFDKNADNA